MTATPSHPALAMRSIGGFRVLDTTLDGLIAVLERRLASRERTELLFANTNFVMQCHRFVDALSGPETLIANDGIGMDLASMMLHRRRFSANLNGTDFTPRLLRRLAKPTRIFLLGSTPFAVAAAAAGWAKLPNAEIVGALDGFDAMRDDGIVVDRLRQARPDILLLALGNPRQEEWIVAHRGTVDIPLVIGVGALFDFVSGRAKRAPAWVQKVKLEWAYRLAREPRRLAKRYSIDLVRFFVHCNRTRRIDRAVVPR